MKKEELIKVLSDKLEGVVELDSLTVDSLKKLLNPYTDLEKANADLEKANADLEKANADLEKANTDLEKANTDLEKADADLEKANADLEKADADLEKANADLQEYKAVNKDLQGEIKVLGKSAKKAGVKSVARCEYKGSTYIVNTGTHYQGKVLTASELAKNPDAIKFVMGKKGQKTIEKV